MNKLIKYFSLSAAAIALVGCSNDDEPILNPGEVDVETDGTVVSDHLAFTSAVEGFFDVRPDAARSALAVSDHKYWQDKESEMLLSTSYMNPTTIVTQKPAESRGWPINIKVENCPKFDDLYGKDGVRVSASYTKGGADYNWIDNQPFKRNSDGVWRSDEPWFWPRGADKVTLYAYTPQISGYGGSLWIDGYGDNPSICYDTPNFAAEQQDIMVARKEISFNTNGNNGPLVTNDGNTKAVKPLSFQHIMAGLRVRVAIRPGLDQRVNRIDVLQVPVGKGKYHMRDQYWETRSDNAPVDVYTSKISDTSGKYKNYNDFEMQPHTYNDFMTWEQTFMLIPQTLNSSTILRLFFVNGTTYDISLNGVQLEQGKILYLDIQEPSLFVEQMKSFRETRGGTQWPIPNGGRVIYMRLFEGADGNNYYKNLERYQFNWTLPGDDNSDNQAWEVNNSNYFGHRLAFNVLSRTNDNGNIFFHATDMRQNFFIFNKEIEFDYREFKDNNTYRESYFRDKGWGAAPERWESEKIGDNCAPWYCLGGDMDIVVTPEKVNGRYPITGGKGKIRFKPSGNINYPRRICVAGSVNRYPYLIVEPFENGGDRNTNYFKGWDGEAFDNTNDKTLDKTYKNLRSYREHYLKLIDNNNGIYEGDIIVNQWTPAMTDKGDYCILPGWRGGGSGTGSVGGFGSVMFYTSTLHGSYGHGNHPADEYESRLGVITDIDYDPSGDSDEGTVNNFGHTYTGAYMKLKTGKYFIRINLTDRTFYYRRTSDYVDRNNMNNSKDWRAFKFPHTNLRNYWYDVFRNGGTYWYAYLSADGWGPNGTQRVWFKAGSYVYDTKYLNSGKNPATTDYPGWEPYN